MGIASIKVLIHSKKSFNSKMTEKVTILEAESEASTPLEEVQPTIVLVPSDSEENESQDSSSREYYAYKDNRKRARLEHSSSQYERNAESNLVDAIKEIATVQKGILETLKDISRKLSVNNVTIKPKTSCNEEIAVSDEKKNETQEIVINPSVDEDNSSNISPSNKDDMEKNKEEKNKVPKKTRKLQSRNSK